MPRRERAPVVWLSRLAFVHQADDALGQSGTVVGLNAARVDRRVAPPRGNELFRGGRTRVASKRAESATSGRRGRTGRPGKASAAESAEHHQDGHGPLGIRGRYQGQLDVHLDGRKCRVVYVANELFTSNRQSAHDAVGDLLRHSPAHRRDALRHPANDFALEVLEDLGAALLPPLLGGCHFLAISQGERVGEIGVRIGLLLIVIGTIGSAGAAAGAGPEPDDPQLLHHILMVLGIRPLQSWRGVVRRGRLSAENNGGEGHHQQSGEPEGTMAGRCGVSHVLLDPR